MAGDPTPDTGQYYGQPVQGCPHGVTREDIKGWTVACATISTRLSALEPLWPEIQKTREEMAALHACLKAKNGFIERERANGRDATPATVVVQFGKKQWGVLGGFAAGVTVITNVVIQWKVVLEALKGVIGVG